MFSLLITIFIFLLAADAMFVLLVFAGIFSKLKSAFEKNKYPFLYYAFVFTFSFVPLLISAGMFVIEVYDSHASFASGFWLFNAGMVFYLIGFIILSVYSYFNPAVLPESSDLQS